MQVTRSTQSIVVSSVHTYEFLRHDLLESIRTDLKDAEMGCRYGATLHWMDLAIRASSDRMPDWIVAYFLSCAINETCAPKLPFDIRQEIEFAIFEFAPTCLRK